MVKCMCFLPLCQFHEEGLCCGHVNVSAALACSQVIPHLLRKQSFSFQLNGTLCFDQPRKARQILVFLVVPSKCILYMFLDPITEYVYIFVHIISPNIHIHRGLNLWFQEQVI